MCGSRFLVSSVGRAFAKAVVGYEGFVVGVDCLLPPTKGLRLRVLGRV